MTASAGRARGGAGPAALPGLAALVWLFAACGDSPAVLAPVIDVPVGDPDATASQLDEIMLTVAHAGSDTDLVAQTFATGDPLELTGVPFGDDLVIHMSGYIGASNIAYGRSCTIAVSPTQTPPAPHLFFSLSVKFASLAISPTQRIGGLGISFLGSGILVGGDTESGDPVSTVEQFDPLTGQLTTLGTVSPRDGAVQALLGTSPPRVIVIGGSTSGGGAGFVEMLDNHSIDRLDVPQVDIARVGLTATALTDGRVMVIGGAPAVLPGAPAAAPIGEIDEIDPDGAMFDIEKVAVALAHPRSGHTATRLGDDVGAAVLIAGGVDANNAPVAAAELYKPLSASLSTTFAPMMNIPRSHHTATLMPDGSVLIIGGLDALGQPVRTLELFSVDAGFAEVGDLPMAAGVIDMTATTLPDGRILLTGGRAAPGGVPLDSAYIARLDLLDGQVDVVATDNLAVARANHQAMTLCDGTVLITGGNAAGFAAERYNPPPLDRR